MSNFTNARGLSRKLRLTPAIIAREIRAARAAGQRITITDLGCSGLRLIIGARTATWSVTAQPRGLDAEGKRFPLKSVTIGDATELDPESARKLAATVKREISLGHDPVAARREQRRQQAQAARSSAEKRDGDAIMLERILHGRSQPIRGQVAILDYRVLAHAALSDCAAAFLLHGFAAGRLHREQTTRQLRLALAEMGVANLKPKELHKQHIRALVALHAGAGRPATGRHRHSAVKRLFGWLQSVDVIESNPSATVRAPAPPPPRSNVPTAADVRALWIAAEKLPPPRCTFVKLATLLPLRRQELADLTFGNIVRDHDGLEIRLSAGQTKNAKPFTLPVIGAAAAIIEALLARGGSPGDALIPFARSVRPFANWKSLTKQIARAGDGLHFQWHDTRRLFASELAEHGIGNFGLIDSLLNHERSASRSGAARSYHHGSEKAAKVGVMVAWDKILLYAAEHGRWPRQTPAAGNVVQIVAK